MAPSLTVTHYSLFAAAQYIQPKMHSFLYIAPYILIGSHSSKFAQKVGLEPCVKADQSVFVLSAPESDVIIIPSWGTIPGLD